jgi:valyl-tRNA synthetase
VQGQLELADRWILARLNDAVRDVTRSLEAFRFQEAAETLHRFFWNELADWYLELVKPRFRDDGAGAGRAAAQATLVEVLDGVFRLLHPLMPFISEELWRRLPTRGGSEREASLIIARWPQPRADRADDDAEQQIAALIELITAVRSIRTEYNVPPGHEIAIRVSTPSRHLQGALAVEERAVRRLARISSIETSLERAANGKGGAHVVLRGGSDVFIALADLIDVEKERARLQAEMTRVHGQLRGTETKLLNEQFIARAPGEVVDHERKKADSLRDQLQRLQEKLDALQ